jgi:hypothetical protein
MADETEKVENLTLQYLRRIDGKVDGLVEDVRDIKVRITNVEEGVVLVNRRLDRIDNRLERIERRLDLHDPAITDDAGLP